MKIMMKVGQKIRTSPSLPMSHPRITTTAPVTDEESADLTFVLSTGKFQKIVVLQQTIGSGQMTSDHAVKLAEEPFANVLMVIRCD